MSLPFYPVRCYSCGKVLSEKYLPFKEQIAKIRTYTQDTLYSELQREDILQRTLFFRENLGIERFCCKRMLLSAESLQEYSRF